MTSRIAIGMVIAIQCRRAPCSPVRAIVEIFDRVYNFASCLFYCSQQEMCPGLPRFRRGKNARRGETFPVRVTGCAVGAPVKRGAETCATPRRVARSLSRERRAHLSARPLPQCEHVCMVRPAREATPAILLVGEARPSSTRPQEVGRGEQKDDRRENAHEDQEPHRERLHHQRENTAPGTSRLWAHCIRELEIVARRLRSPARPANGYGSSWDEKGGGKRASCQN